ncbi:MAG: nucleotidyltransferase family protein [Pseudomonadota bacterium]
MHTTAEQEVAAAALSSPLLRPVLDRWDSIALPNCWLVAGAVAQTVWNVKLGNALDHGIRDVDLVYFDQNTLDHESERREETRIRSQFGDASASFDVKNEARVHLWYEDRFGYPIAPYRSVEDAIATFPTTATAIGIRSNHGRIEVIAPFGLSDLLNLRVRANKRQITREVYEAKIGRWREIWPQLHVVEW